MDIDFIRWMAQKAGIRIVKDLYGDEYVYFTEYWWCGIECIESDELLLNGYLLQRAIEGVNREHFNKGSYAYPYEIKQLIDCYMVKEHDKAYEENDKYTHFNFSVKMNHDQAKKSALKYVYAMENSSSDDLCDVLLDGLTNVKESIKKSLQKENNNG